MREDVVCDVRRERQASIGLATKSNTGEKEQPKPWPASFLLIQLQEQHCTIDHPTTLGRTRGIISPESPEPGYVQRPAPAHANLASGAHQRPRASSSL